MRWSATRPEPGSPVQVQPAPRLPARAPRRAVERDAGTGAAAQQAGVPARAAREVSGTSRDAAASLVPLDRSDDPGRAALLVDEVVRRVVGLPTGTMPGSTS